MTWTPSQTSSPTRTATSTSTTVPTLTTTSTGTPQRELCDPHAPLGGPVHTLRGGGGPCYQAIPLGRLRAGASGALLWPLVWVQVHALHGQVTVQVDSDCDPAPDPSPRAHYGPADAGHARLIPAPCDAALSLQVLHDPPPALQSGRRAPDANLTVAFEIVHIGSAALFVPLALGTLTLTLSLAALTAGYGLHCTSRARARADVGIFWTTGQGVPRWVSCAGLSLGLGLAATGGIWVLVLDALRHPKVGWYGAMHVGLALAAVGLALAVGFAVVTLRDAPGTPCPVCRRPVSPWRWVGVRVPVGAAWVRAHASCMRCRRHCAPTCWPWQRVVRARELAGAVWAAGPPHVPYHEGCWRAHCAAMMSRERQEACGAWCRQATEVEVACLLAEIIRNKECAPRNPNLATVLGSGKFRFTHCAAVPGHPSPLHLAVAEGNIEAVDVLLGCKGLAAEPSQRRCLFGAALADAPPPQASLLVTNTAPAADLDDVYVCNAALTWNERPVYTGLRTGAYVYRYAPDPHSEEFAEMVNKEEREDRCGWRVSYHLGWPSPHWLPMERATADAEHKPAADAYEPPEAAELEGADWDPAAVAAGVVAGAAFAAAAAVAAQRQPVVQRIRHKVSFIEVALSSSDDEDEGQRRKTIGYVIDQYKRQHPECVVWQYEELPGLWQPFHRDDQATAHEVLPGDGGGPVELSQDYLADRLPHYRRVAGDARVRVRSQLRPLLQYFEGGEWRFTCSHTKVAQSPEQSRVLLVPGAIACAAPDPAMLRLLIDAGAVDPFLWAPPSKVWKPKLKLPRPTAPSGKPRLSMSAPSAADARPTASPRAPNPPPVPNSAKYLQAPAASGVHVARGAPPAIGAREDGPPRRPRRFPLWRWRAKDAGQTRELQRPPPGPAGLQLESEAIKAEVKRERHRPLQFDAVGGLDPLDQSIRHVPPAAACPPPETENKFIVQFKEFQMQKEEPYSECYAATYPSEGPMGTLQFCMALPGRAKSEERRFSDVQQKSERFADLRLRFDDAAVYAMCAEAVMKFYEIGRQRETLWPGLQQSHVLAVFVYTYELPDHSQIYSNMGKAIREREPARRRLALEFWRPLIWRLDCALEALQPPPSAPQKPLSAYRGVKRKMEDEMGTDAMENSPVRWAAFSSTSADRRAPFKFADTAAKDKESTIFLIHYGTADDVPVPNEAVLPTAIERFSKFPEEREVLFPRNSEFVIKRYVPRGKLTELVGMDVNIVEMQFEGRRRQRPDDPDRFLGCEAPKDPAAGAGASASASASAGTSGTVGSDASADAASTDARARPEAPHRSAAPGAAAGPAPHTSALDQTSYEYGLGLGLGLARHMNVQFLLSTGLDPFGYARAHDGSAHRHVLDESFGLPRPSAEPGDVQRAPVPDDDSGPSPAALRRFLWRPDNARRDPSADPRFTPSPHVPRHVTPLRQSGIVRGLATLSPGSGFLDASSPLAPLPFGPLDHWANICDTSSAPPAS